MSKEVKKIEDCNPEEYIESLEKYIKKLEQERDGLKEDYKTVCKSYDNCEHEYELQLKIGNRAQQELQALKGAVNKLPSIHDPVYQTDVEDAFKHYGIDCKLALDKLKALIK